MRATPGLRFREARERLGLSPDEVAARSGISSADVWEIGGLDGDLTCCYSPKQLRQLCGVLGIHPVELFGGEVSEPVSPEELVRLIHEECRLRGVTLEQFEDLVEWRLSACIEPPKKLLEDMTVDAAVPNYPFFGLAGWALFAAFALKSPKPRTGSFCELNFISSGCIFLFP
jgi:transcriptional regulator with XRE-family HTH domain